jgi:hypothetical protein
VTAKKPAKSVGRKDPWLDPDWDVADASAIQHLFRGDANEQQQKRAINFIVNEICALPYMAFDGKSERNTTFALGKQSVGHFIVRLWRLNLSQFTGENKRGD